MKPDSMTYRQLDQILSHLGFKRDRVKPKWLRYNHEDSDTMIVVVEKKPNEMVRPIDALSARLHLVQKGLISDEELDGMLTPKRPVKRKR